MLEILIFSLVVVTWMSYGLHVIKEYIRHSGEKDDTT